MKDITLSARLAMVDKNPDSQEAKLSVRRRLNFGDENDDNQPTREELYRQYQEDMAKEREEKMKKWNYDFENDRPLEGRWQWERVQQPCENRNGTAAPGNADAPGSADASADRPQGDAVDQAH